MPEPGSGSALGDALRRFRPSRVLVYGDLILDDYMFGQADRLSPERPVPVVTYQRRDLYLGGAGNVVRNLEALGCEPILVTAVGEGEAGNECRAQMAAGGLALDGLVEVENWSTPRKLRVHAGQHALVRIDFETLRPEDRQVDAALEDALARLAPGCQGAVVSDYRKGAVTAAGVERLKRSLGDAPVVVDPKGIHADLYRSGDYLLPNERELADLLGGEWDDPGAERLLEHLDLEAIVLTRSERGVRLYGGGVPTDIPARARQVYDVTGAGDTFAAAFAAFLLSGETAETAARLANVAAGIKVRKVGTATVTRDEIREEVERGPATARKQMDARAASSAAAERRMRGETVVFTNGCFDLLHAGHIKYLEASRALGDCLIVGLNTDASVARLKGPDRPILDEAERSEILSALRCVDYVVLFDEDTPISLIEAIRPDVLTKGTDYSRDEVVGGDLVESYGGRVERIDLVAGKSTTGIIERIADSRED
jgi:D-beta-D-heptose 7-phosphate kinase / D-beta-D-heptose 1-phosphate adenosyltransferase